MDEKPLGELVFDRVAADTGVTDAVKELVVAAFDGHETLSAALAGSRPATASDTDDEIAAGEPAGVFLRAIRVQGFRGVGPAATLTVRPGPGLTVVTGRNGSGKSSFAEAAELALTGTSSRWEGKNNKNLWQDGWRNLHAADSTAVAVELACTGRPPTTVRLTWAADATLDDRTWTRQDTGEKQVRLDRGWPDTRAQHRPFLSYGELGALIDSKPSELHDALHRLLGLEALTDAVECIRGKRSELEKRTVSLREDKKALIALLREIDDPRARRAEAALRPYHPDLSALAELVLGDDGDATAIDRLRALEHLCLPEADRVHAATQEVHAALANSTVARTADAAAARSIALLLQTALDHQRDHGDGPCPLCGEGRLDADWRSRAEGDLAAARSRDQELRRTQARLTAAVDVVRGLVTPVPMPLHRASTMVDIGAAASTWRAWHDSINVEDPAALAQAVESGHAEVAMALADLRDRVRTELTRLDEVWRPVAGRLLAWHDVAQRVVGEADTLRDLKAAEKWLKEAAGDLRKERMAPFAARSRHIWQLLRQESNVDLGAIELVGSHNQRRAVVDVTVDGSASAALTVMSQGELHALGLSLFLPRATTDDSPFRFVMIDDPVQAMDPAKVDGLARVLAEVAATRQVIVFSHDDRLADAVRRLPNAATILEVQRGDRSHVDVVGAFDPVERYLDDARSLVRTKHLPADLCGELVSTCCRGALEAAAHDRVRAVRLGRGDRHDDVEAALARAEKTRQKLRLAMFDDMDAREDLHARLDNVLGTGATRTVNACTRGAHAGYTGSLDDLIRNTERIATWLRR